MAATEFAARRCKYQGAFCTWVQIGSLESSMYRLSLVTAAADAALRVVAVEMNDFEDLI